MAPFYSKNEDRLVQRLENFVDPLNKLKIALDVSNLAILVFDHTTLCYLNRPAEQLLNLSEGQACGLDLQKLQLSEAVKQSVIDAVQHTLRSSATSQSLVSLRKRSYQVQAKLATDKLVLLTFEPHHSRAEVHRQNEALEEILSTTTTILSQRVPADETSSQLCLRILEFMTSLEALSFSPSSDSKQPKLGELTTQLIALLRYSLPAAVKLDLTLPETEVETEIPGEKIRRLVLSLLLAAAAEIEQKGSLALALRECDESVIFELNVQASNSFLELDNELSALARLQAEKLGGHIVMWSEPERRVRLLNIPKTQAPVKLYPIRPTGLPGKGKTILIVDDEESIRAVSRTALSKLGFEVLLAKDGKDGVQVFAENKDRISLVLLDLVMPRLGGAGCFEQLKKLDPKVKVVLMSGFTRNHRVDELLSQGCLYFLRKPFELADLISVTQEVTEENPV